MVYLLVKKLISVTCLLLDTQEYVITAEVFSLSLISSGGKIHSVGLHLATSEQLCCGGWTVTQ